MLVILESVRITSDQILGTQKNKKYIQEVVIYRTQHLDGVRK